MGRRILITGAAVGIGAAIARRLAAGNELLLHYCGSETEAHALAVELKSQCRSVTVVQADLTSDEGCVGLARAASARWQAVDTLINNAGGMIERKNVDELGWDHLAKTMELNVLSVMRLTSLLVPALRRGSSSSVINITSIAIRHGSPTATSYGAAKAAVDAFTRGAATELGPEIRVNAVAPGIIDTRFHERLTPEAKMAQFKSLTPLKKHGAAVDVAATVAFLLDNPFMTGATIDCNGGLHMR